MEQVVYVHVVQKLAWPLNQEAKMLTREEHALVTEIGDKLLDLYAQRDEAIQEGNLDRAHRLQAEISEVVAERQEILRSIEDV
jgi:molybdenum-dependent DNA-binding transcriptional regulator ModE